MSRLYFLFSVFLIYDKIPSKMVFLLERDNHRLKKPRMLMMRYYPCGKFESYVHKFAAYLTFRNTAATDTDAITVGYLWCIQEAIVIYIHLENLIVCYDIKKQLMLVTLVFRFGGLPGKLLHVARLFRHTNGNVMATSMP